jgi:acetolactate synthase-1/2/3 large subunit
MPVATGAAVACPDRKVINMQADGSAMYTLQSLWTQAREQLDVLTVIFNNRNYAILQGEMKTIGLAIGPKAHDMLRIDSPTLDFVSLAQGMGVPASRATTQDEFNAALAIGLREKGPRLIEAMI